MNLIQAIAAVRPYAGQQPIHVDVSLVDNPTRRVDQQTVEYSIYVPGTGGELAWCHESASTLEDAVACAIAKLRPTPDEPIALACAALEWADDPRR